MSLIRLQNVTKRFDDHLILREVFFRLSQGDRVGLIGRNGTGKTTLFKLILGTEEPTEGAVATDLGLEIGYFSQFSELHGESTVVEILDEVFTPVRAVEKGLAEVEDALEQEPDDKTLERLLDQQAGLFEEMERLDGWSADLRMDTVLTKLGFSEAHRQRPMDQLSGGWRNRAALARLLLVAPTVLLMDEPTNYLDIEGLTWLEGWLRKKAGALIAVSHDRHFLEAVVNKVVEVENHHLQEYQGGFADYVREKQLRLKALGSQFEHEEALLAQEEAAIQRRRAASGRSPGRRGGGAKKGKNPQSVGKIINAAFKGLSAPEVVCTVQGVSKAYAEQTVLREVSFELRRRQRLAILGPNGCGKSTLLRMITGSEQPDEGEIRWGVRENVVFSYYNLVLEELDLSETVAQAVGSSHQTSPAPRKVVSRFLGLMQLSELHQRQRLETLSGGQRARVALARCLLSGAQVLILDEPTNHLDLSSTQVMEHALARFPGSVIVVSHDRFFIDKVATRLLVFEGEGRVREVGGSWSRMQARRKQ